MSPYTHICGAHHIFGLIFQSIKFGSVTYDRHTTRSALWRGKLLSHDLAALVVTINFPLSSLTKETRQLIDSVRLEYTRLEFTD